MKQPYTITEIKHLNRAAGGTFFDISHIRADRREGRKVRLSKTAENVIEVWQDGEVVSMYIFNSQTGRIEPYKPFFDAKLKRLPEEINKSEDIYK